MRRRVRVEVEVRPVARFAARRVVDDVDRLDVVGDRLQPVAPDQRRFARRAQVAAVGDARRPGAQAAALEAVGEDRVARLGRRRGGRERRRWGRGEGCRWRRRESRRRGRGRRRPAAGRHRDQPVLGVVSQVVGQRPDDAPGHVAIGVIEVLLHAVQPLDGVRVAARIAVRPHPRQTAQPAA